MPPTAKKPCKLCGEKKRYANTSWCFSCHKQREKAKKEEKKSRALARKIASKTFQKSERKKWHKKCWGLMSEFIRRSGADWRGYQRCYTCTHTAHWKTLQAGHYFHGKLDFDERNLKPQCWMCNMRKNGCGAEYGMRLIRENGLDWVKQLELDANTHLGYSLEDLKRIHGELTEKIAALNIWWNSTGCSPLPTRS